jgi:chloramphenicol-sensitive protein RarD
MDQHEVDSAPQESKVGAFRASSQTSPQIVTPNSSKGIALSVMASCLFGGLYYYSTLLTPLDGEDIFAWRMIFTVPFILLGVHLMGEGHRVRLIFQRLARDPVLGLVLIASSAFLGLQLWLFMWAPLHDKALEVSLGYFMLPLTMVLTGRLVYGERLSGWQKLGTAAASIGVAHEVLRVGGFPIEALTVALGYPIYFVLRKRFQTNHVGGLWFDLVLLLPVAGVIAWMGPMNAALLSEHSQLLWLVPLLGLISAAALMAYMASNRLLSFGLFGLLGYVEPVLLLLVALILGDLIQPDEYLTYIPIWLAVGCLVAEGVQHLIRRRPS